MLSNIKDSIFYDKNRILGVIILLVFIISSASNVTNAVGIPLKDRFESGGGTAVDGETTLKNEIYYSQAVVQYEEKGYMDTKGQNIVLIPNDITAASSKEIPLKKIETQPDHDVLDWKNTGFDWFEWKFKVEEEGLYEINIEYNQPEGSGSKIERAIMVNGEYVFREAHNIGFNRMWVDEGKPLENNLGDQVKPQQLEKSAWMTIPVQDSLGSYSGALKFYFKKGENTLRLEYVAEPIEIAKIEINSPMVIPGYDEYITASRSLGAKDAVSEIKIQAEESVLYKSSPTLSIQSNSDPLCEPVSVSKRVYNEIGDYAWHSGGEKITFSIDVAEDGLYKIGLRDGQWWNDGLPSFRQILIDNTIPFEEMREYQFNYSDSWRSEVLKNKKGDPFKFYLKKGSHTISMTVVMGEYASILESINTDLLVISKLIRQIMMITGTNPDVNYQYDLDKSIPDLMSTLKYLRDSMQNDADFLNSLATKRSSTANSFIQIKQKLIEMINNPDSIPRKLSDLNSAVADLGSWYMAIKVQPLSIDYISLMPPQSEFKNYKATIFQNISATVQNFILSFFKDYDSVGSTMDNKYGEIDKPTLNVWISRGQEWAEIIKELADADFTKNTGIKVKMNILPASQLNAGSVNALMLSVSSGKAPDVAMGVASGSPVEFAIRGAVADLSKYKDFETTQQQFLPKLMIPFQYQGGVYALPETMNFRVLFYRKDIFEELKIKIPDTWDELYQYVFPVLYQNGMQFYFGPDLSPFLFQNDGDFYTSDGLKTALDTPQAFKAFKQMTELYTNYGVPMSANFFNHFRTGDMPVGVESYGTYIMLSVAAPELKGRWGIAQIPGTLKSDGSIDRSYAGISAESCIIMNQSKNKQESWDLLKWWTSENVQTSFGRQIESLVGVEARWNTANTNSFKKLPWIPEDLKEIEKSWQWGREIPVVLGGYFTGREISNAWNRVVIRDLSLGGNKRDTNPRDSLELAVKNINKELASQQAQYGLIP